MSTGRRERKKQELRERIVDAAYALIAQQGLARTTVDQIAERTDIAQATFFNYFATKSDLVDALVDRLIDQFDELVDKAHDADSSMVHKVKALYLMTAEMTQGEHRVLRDIIAETVRSPKVSPERSLTRMRSVFTADIEAGQAQGEVRRDQSSGALADAVLGLYVSVMLFWSTDADYPVADRLRTSLDLALHLMRPPTTP